MGGFEKGGAHAPVAPPLATALSLHQLTRVRLYMIAMFNTYLTMVSHLPSNTQLVSREYMCRARPITVSGSSPDDLFKTSTPPSIYTDYKVSAESDE